MNANPSQLKSIRTLTANALTMIADAAQIAQSAHEFIIEQRLTRLLNAVRAEDDFLRSVQLQRELDGALRPAAPQRLGGQSPARMIASAIPPEGFRNAD